mmetsp:Transcript_28549/g.38081  ORF Transcript_28549/g.38081 Transcript_28549/m.38081 type:complete len:184 (-) Transcript_28549:2085-2636(-)
MPLEDYQTVHPNVLAQPDFNFLPAGLKIARVEEYHRLKAELSKTRETRQVLERADQDSTQSRLMSRPSELSGIVEHLDADPVTSQEHGKFSDLWFINRMKKISGSVDGLVSKITGEDLGVSGLDWENVEQVFSPLTTGVAPIDRQMQRLVANGMSIDLAETLARDYLNRVAQTSSVHTLMDFF